MFNRPHLVFIYLITVLLIVGFIVRVNVYESNQLINLNSSSAHLMMNADSFKHLSLKKGDSFNYFIKNQKYRSPISDIHKTNEKEYVLTLNLTKENSDPITAISYKIGRWSIWSSIFR